MKKVRNQIKKYTAFVPKTFKATKNVGKITIKKAKYFFRNSIKSIKNTTKMLNNKTSKKIRSFTKRRLR